MAVAEQPGVRSAPSPEECEHPAPVTGIMAHEFSPYSGAQGPEGVRRTTMYYGPVVGGLPIGAWHCEACGLLRLTYPDGRKEQRQLFPGPQPGLISATATADPDHVVGGRQARVSGLSGEAFLFEAAEAPLIPVAVTRSISAAAGLGAVTLLTVLGLAFVAVGLLVAGWLAVYDYQTASGEAGLVTVVAAVFGGVVVLQIGAATVRHLFPADALPTSVAVSHRQAPAPEGATLAAVWLLALAAIGLLASGYLAVYDYQTSGLEEPVLVATLISGGLAVVVLVADAIRRHLTRS